MESWFDMGTPSMVLRAVNEEHERLFNPLTQIIWNQIFVTVQGSRPDPRPNSAPNPVFWAPLKSASRNQCNARRFPNNHNVFWVRWVSANPWPARAQSSISECLLKSMEKCIRISITERGPSARSGPRWSWWVKLKHVMIQGFWTGDGRARRNGDSDRSL